MSQVASVQVQITVGNDEPFISFIKFAGLQLCHCDSSGNRTLEILVLNNASIQPLYLINTIGFCRSKFNFNTYTDTIHYQTK